MAYNLFYFNGPRACVMSSSSFQEPEQTFIEKSRRPPRNWSVDRRAADIMYLNRDVALLVRAGKNEVPASLAVLQTTLTEHAKKLPAPAPIFQERRRHRAHIQSLSSGMCHSRAACTSPEERFRLARGIGRIRRLWLRRYRALPPAGVLAIRAKTARKAVSHF